MHIVDRRLNPSGKNLANRQRFMRRAKSLIRKAVHETSASRSIKDADQEGEVSLPAQGVHEPSLHRSHSGGMRDHLLPGNKEYIEGDTIPRPQGGAGGGGSEGSPGRRGAGRFPLRAVARRVRRPVPGRPGTARPGQAPGGECRGGDLAPRRLFGDRLARQPGAEAHGAEQPVAADRAAAAEDRASWRSCARKSHALSLDGEDQARRLQLEAELERKLRRTSLIPYIDPLDVRYRRFEAQPKPVAQAVMFCLMDVSGSMTEHMKDLAKRFYVLLYIFLKRRYKNVDVVFIRHTHQAQEVDEDTFFHSPETGGTVVSTALEEMQRVIEERYSPDIWNIYAAQASDGDNTASDNDKTAALLIDVILPVCQVLRLSGSRPRFRAFPARLHPPRQRSVADLHRDLPQRRADGDAQGGPPPRHLPGVPRAVRPQVRTGTRDGMRRQEGSKHPLPLWERPGRGVEHDVSAI